MKLADRLAENRAVYLPALSKGFVNEVGKAAPTGVPGIVRSDLNFLDPASKLFHYPVALYSAGQAAPQSGEAAHDIVTNRDRSATVIVGDSGGFQVQEGTIKFNAATPDRMMRWMEAVSDYSMILDFPTGGIGLGNVKPHVARLKAEGHDLDALNAANRMGFDYNACLLQTLLNNDYFVQHRTPGATNFLNVIQGRNERESAYWYEQVRHYSFEGWSFAGAHNSDFALLMNRLLDMARDGLLQEAKWIHVLGKSTLPTGVLLTVVQRAIREHINPNIQISFDTSSPFKLAANYKLFTGASFSGRGWLIHTLVYSAISQSDDFRVLRDVIVDELSRRPHARLGDTAISKIAEVGQLRDPQTGMMTGDGSRLLMNHNVEVMIDGHDQAHDVFFDPIGVRDDTLIPIPIKQIAALIDIAFRGGGKNLAGEWEAIDPREHIKRWAHYLASLS